jgi:hypothetical protein
MNQIKLSLRAADDSRTIKEEGGVPTFATVFALHNAARRGREETIPITVKASHELALTLVLDLRKGTAFVVEGQLSYFKHPDQSRKLLHLGGQFHRHHRTQIQTSIRP